MENNELKDKKLDNPKSAKNNQSSTLEMAKELGILDDNHINSKNHESDLLRLKAITTKKQKKKKKKKSKDVNKDDLSKLLTIIFDPNNKELVEEFVKENNSANSIKEVFEYIKSKKSNNNQDKIEQNFTKNSENELELKDFLTTTTNLAEDKEKKSDNQENIEVNNSNSELLSLLINNKEDSSSNNNILDSNSLKAESKDKNSSNPLDNNSELSLLVKEEPKEIIKDTKDNEKLQIDRKNSSSDELLSLLNEDKEVNSNSNKVVNILNENSIEENRESKTKIQNNNNLELLNLIEDDNSEVNNSIHNKKELDNNNDLLALLEDEDINKDTKPTPKTQNNNDLEPLNLIEDDNSEVNNSIHNKKELDSNNDLLALLEDEDINKDTKPTPKTQNNNDLELLNLIEDDNNEVNNSIPNKKELDSNNDLLALLEDEDINKDTKPTPKAQNNNDLELLNLIEDDNIELKSTKDKVKENIAQNKDKKIELNEDNKELLDLLTIDNSEQQENIIKDNHTKKEHKQTQESIKLDKNTKEDNKESNNKSQDDETDELLKLLLEENNQKDDTPQESEQVEEENLEDTGELKINLADIEREIAQGNYGYSYEESSDNKTNTTPVYNNIEDEVNEKSKKDILGGAKGLLKKVKKQKEDIDNSLDEEEFEEKPKKDILNGVKKLFKKEKNQKEDIDNNLDEEEFEEKSKKDILSGIKKLFKKENKQKEEIEELEERKKESKKINLKKLFKSKDSKPKKAKKDLKELFNIKLFKGKNKKSIEEEQIEFDKKIADIEKAIELAQNSSNDTIIKGVITPNNTDNYVESTLEDEIKEFKDESSTNNIQLNSNTIKRASGVMEFQPFVFKGETKEFFKIWIVNILLTIVTLGVYSAWAKVRTNRYIYSSTFLNNSNFEFNADPKRILYGRAIVVGLYGLFSYFSNISYNAMMALGIFVGFLLVLPWLIRQAISFKLKSASYRNVHFRYTAKVSKFYAFALKMALYAILAISPLIIVGWLGNSKNKIATLESYRIGILNYINQLGIDIKLLSLIALLSTLVMVVIFIPSLYKQFKTLVINNSAYGQTKFKFVGTNKGAINTFFKISISNIVATIALGGVTFIVIKLFGNIFNLQHLNFHTQSGNLIITAGVMFIYLAFIGLYKGINDAHLSNYVRNNTKLEHCEFQSDISAYKLGIIGMTNMIAIVLSFGLLYPWAKMRYLKYKLSNTYFACDNYDRFASAGRSQGNAIGEEATDFFDIDIGI